MTVKKLKELLEQFDEHKNVKYLDCGVIGEIIQVSEEEGLGEEGLGEDVYIKSDI